MKWSIILLASLVAAASCVLAAQLPKSPSPSAGATAAAPLPSAVASPSLTQPSSSATPTPLAQFENVILGYRLSLPSTYRRSFSNIVVDQTETLGSDLYTTQSEADALAECQHDAGEIPTFVGRDRDPDVRVAVSRNVAGVSALAWATTPRVPGAQPLSTHQKVEQVTIGGWEAVRLVEDNVNAYTTAFVIRANDRMYEIGPTFSAPSRLSRSWLDDVVRTFVATQPSAFPSPSPTVPPRTAARDLALALAQAFEARDVEAIARLMPSCYLATWPEVDGMWPGGLLNRSLPQFLAGLRQRFASGNLTIAVDPVVRTQTRTGFTDELLFVSSDWKESDRVTRIDLYLAPFDGQWLWRWAVHQQTKAQAQSQPVWFCRSPWISGPDRC